MYRVESGTPRYDWKSSSNAVGHKVELVVELYPMVLELDSCVELVDKQRTFRAVGMAFMAVTNTSCGKPKLDKSVEQADKTC